VAKKRADAVVNYPGQQKVVASVATTKDMLVLTLGDERPEHYTYPPSGDFHVTMNDASSRSFFAPGPAFPNLDYYRFALVAVPVDPTELVRPYKAKNRAVMMIPPPVAREGMLEIGVMGQLVTPPILVALQADGALVATFSGPRSGTTVVYRYTP